MHSPTSTHFSIGGTAFPTSAVTILAPKSPLCISTQDISAPCPEKQSPSYLGLPISDLLKVFPPKEEDPDPQVLMGNQQQVELPGICHRYPLPSPMIGKKTFFWKQGGRLPLELPETWSEVEYARVVIIQKNNSPEESRVCLNGSLSKCQTPPSSCPGPKYGKGVWLQNLTYEALVDVGSHHRGPLDVTEEFPLLVSLAAMAGDLQASESLHGGSQKNP